MSKATFAASIQAKSGRLYAVIQVKTGKTTKPVWRALGLDKGTPKSTVNKRFREVVTNFEEEYEELLERANRPDSEIPIYEYLKEFVERIKPNIQYNTYVSYHGMVEGKIKRYFEENPHLTIGNITAKEIEKFYTHLFSFGVKSNTVIHYHAILHKAFKQAFKDDLIIANPFDKVTRPKKNEFQGSFYSKEEMQKLLELAKDDPIYTAIMVSGTMGLRRSETLGVRWSRIDWEAKSLLLDTKVIEKKINGKKVPTPVEVMKNKSSKRTMAIPDMAYDLLKEQKTRQEIYKEMFGKNYNHKFDDYVCVDPMGNLLKPSYVTDHFSLLLEKIGMRHIRFHDLRHTVASLLINNGVPLTHVSDYLGHADIKVTANTYGHLDKTSKTISANVINSVLNNNL